MFKNHVYGIDLGSNMIKIYSQNSNEILKEKNMIAIRNKDTVLAVGDEAYEIYEKNPTNVKVSSPMLNGMIANISYQLASESLVKVIASEPCSEPPMLLGD